MSVENAVLWTEKDYRKGWCTGDDVGKPIPMAMAVDVVVDAGSAADSEPASLVITPAAIRLARERGVALNDAEGMALIMMELDHAGFAKSNPTIYLDIIKTQRSEREKKQLESKHLVDITATRLNAMNNQDLMIKFCLAIFAEADDVRDRMLARMGVSVADLQEMIED